MKLKYLFVMVLMAALLTGCVEEYKTTTVKAVVIEKDYDAPKTTTKRVKQGEGYVNKKKHHPAEYDVTVSYNNIEAEFDNKKLYNSVKEGQKVQVIYEKGYDKNGKLVSETLKYTD